MHCSTKSDPYTSSATALRLTDPRLTGGDSSYSRSFDSERSLHRRSNCRVDSVAWPTGLEVSRTRHYYFASSCRSTTSDCPRRLLYGTWASTLRVFGNIVWDLAIYRCVYHCRRTRNHPSCQHRRTHHFVGFAMNAFLGCLSWDMNMVSQFDTVCYHFFGIYLTDPVPDTD